MPIYRLLLGAACVLAAVFPGWRSQAQIALDDMAFLQRPAHVAERYETMLDLARALDLGYLEIAAANPGISPWVAAWPKQLNIPVAHILPTARRRGILINLADQRLYFFQPEGVLKFSAPIGIGATALETPLGSTVIVRKRVKPTWYPPDSIRQADPDLPKAVPPGPQNPLGAFALDLAWTSYAIHGTNNPWSIGRRATHGCIRLYPEDIEALFELVSIGTTVTVVDQPIKVGWFDGALWLEVHPTQAQASEIEETGHFTQDALDISTSIAAILAGRQMEIDWETGYRLLAERRGLPVLVGRWP